jgi:hypothetical protein
MRSVVGRWLEAAGNPATMGSKPTHRSGRVVVEAATCFAPFEVNGEFSRRSAIPHLGRSQTGGTDSAIRDRAVSALVSS